MIMSSMLASRVTVDYLEGEVKQLQKSVAKLQSGLKKADQEIQDQFESTVEVEIIIYIMVHLIDLKPEIRAHF